MSDADKTANELVENAANELDQLFRQRHMHIYVVHLLNKLVSETSGLLKHRTEAEPSEAQVEVKDRILAERDKGNIAVLGIEGLMTMPIEEFVKQPVDGMLYDLNRGDEVSLTFIHERKWVNDFAVALVIRKLVEQRDASLSVNKQQDK